jgi:hypothetical protein
MELRKVTVPVLLIGIIALAGLGTISLMPGGAQVQASPSCGDTPPDTAHKHYASTKGLTPPAVTREQAIQIATKNAAVPVAKASEIKARYVLFSDNDMGEDTSIGDDFSVRLFYQNVPAWVVTFCGLDIPGQGPSRFWHENHKDAPMPSNHEWNVVLDAKTGDYIEEFAFR